MHDGRTDEQMCAGVCVRNHKMKLKIRIEQSHILFLLFLLDLIGICHRMAYEIWWQLAKNFENKLNSLKKNGIVALTFFPLYHQPDYPPLIIEKNHLWIITGWLADFRFVSTNTKDRFGLFFEKICKAGFGIFIF